MSCDWSEKRQSARIPVDLKAEYTQRGKKQEGKLLNLSLDGCFLRASELYDPGDPLQVSFLIPGASQPMNVQGRVAWGGMIEGPGIRSFGIGVHFEDLTPSSRDQIDQFLRNLLKT